MKMKLPLPKPPIKRQQKTQNVAELNKKLDQLSKDFRAKVNVADFLGAYAVINQAFQIVPNNYHVLMDLAYTELRLKRFDDAYKHYIKAIKNSGAKVDTNIYDGMTEVCHFLNRADETRKFGALALKTKIQQIENEPVVATISTAPPAFNSVNPKENVIAYSLFGGLPRYCETSLINIDLAKEIYPEWTCRFYIDQSVPEKVVTRLQEKGAEVIFVTEQQKEISGLFWRFFVMDDPTVKRFLIRDADSLVSYRERAAVDEWLKSDKWFHTMRDFYSHTELILAGMWGGTHGVFHNIEQHIRDYIKTGRFLNTRVMDQHYLRYCVYPTIYQSVLAHDSQGFEAIGQHFPEYSQHTEFEDLSQFHVGMNEGSSCINVGVQHPTATKVKWELLDDQGEVVCSYDADVLPARIIEVDIPRRYARKIEAKNWTVKIYPYLESAD